MANGNCLVGMQCPKCQSFEPFLIEVTVVVRMHDDGTDAVDADQDWGHESWCCCDTCSFTGRVRDFQSASATP